MENAVSTPMPKSNKIKIGIIIGILLLIIVVSIYVWKKYSTARQAELAEEEKRKRRAEVTLAATKDMITAPVGVVTSGPGSKGHVLGG